LVVRLGQTDYHILADTAYLLLEHILVPFRNKRDLEDHQLAYNRAVKSDSQVVERAFGLLKMKWRRLKFLDIFKMKYAHRMVLVCFCFHNFGLRHNWWIDDAPQVDDNDEVDPDYEFDEERETEAGVEKRRRIAYEFIF
jgi:hypothetical protein